MTEESYPHTWGRNNKLAMQLLHPWAYSLYLIRVFLVEFDSTYGTIRHKWVWQRWQNE